PPVATGNTLAEPTLSDSSGYRSANTLPYQRDESWTLPLQDRSGGGLLELDAGLALADLADEEGLHAIVHQLTLHTLAVVAAHDDHEADPHIEDPVHLRFVDVAQLLEPV